MGGHAVAVDDFARIARQHGALQDHFGGIVYLKLHADGGIGLQVLVLGEGDTAPEPVIGAEIHPGGDRFEDLAPAGVFQVVQPEGDGIDPRGLGQFVHEGFDREDIAVGAERAQGRCPQRQVAHQVLDQPLVRKDVKRVKIPVNAHVPDHCRLGDEFGRGGLAVPAREQTCGARHVRPRPGAHVERVAVTFVAPVDDPAARIDARAQFHRRGGGIGGPGVFFLPRPFQQDRLAGQGAGDKRGVERRIVSAVVAVTAGPRDMLYPHGFRVDIECFGNRVAQEVYSLAVRP